MSAYAKQIMAKAVQYMKNHVGMTEKGGPNIVWVWQEVNPSFQGQPWCAGTDTAAYLWAGADLRKLFANRNSYYCPAWVSLAKSKGWWKTSNPVAGDLVMYDWMGDGIADHTGIAVPGPGELFWAYEGNTAPGNAGSQSNGDGLYYRARPRRHIAGWVDMEKCLDYMIAARILQAPAEAKPSTTVIHNVAPAPKPLAPFQLPSGHWYGVESNDARNHSGLNKQDKYNISLLQKTVGVPRTGRYDAATKAAVRRAQSARKLVVDGEVGAVTWHAFAVRVD